MPAIKILEVVIVITTAAIVTFHIAEMRAIYSRRIRRRQNTGLFPALFIRGLASTLVFANVSVLYVRQIADYPSDNLTMLLIRVQWVLILIVTLVSKIKFISDMRKP